MKLNIIKSTLLYIFLTLANTVSAQDFQGKAYYVSKTTMDISRFGRRQMTEQQKKQMEERMKQWLEKTFVLTFNAEESLFKEDEKLEAPVGGRGPSMWGSSFSSGPQYKNIKSKIFLQDQEFFGKQFLIREELKPFKWIIGNETKQIGNYTVFKATTIRLASDLNWMQPVRNDSNESEEVSSKDDKPENQIVETVEVVAWYSPQIPVSHGPSEYWGLPGLILELSAGNTVMLCSKIIMNPNEKEELKVPNKGKEVTKMEYNQIINEKIQEFRESRGRDRGRRR